MRTCHDHEPNEWRRRSDRQSTHCQCGEIGVEVDVSGVLPKNIVVGLPDVVIANSLQEGRRFGL